MFIQVIKQIQGDGKMKEGVLLISKGIAMSHHIIDEVIATQQIEGLEVTEEIKQLIEKCLDAKISFDIARKIVIDKIKGRS